MKVKGVEISDEILGTFVPIVVYWVYSGIHMMLGGLDRFRLHSRTDEDTKNLVTKRDVVKGVLLQQVVQAMVATLLFTLTGTNNDKVIKDVYERNNTLINIAALCWQFFVGMVVFDTWQYFMHRYLHHNKFLYRHIHSRHHAIVVPYAFGAMYNHPLEGLILDTAGGCMSFLISGMSPRTAIFFFSFATVKGVDDHCGLWLPGSPIHVLFGNNCAYHDIHHQLYGSKFNFSQPFFVIWDRILGTYMPYSLHKRFDGGLEARPAKKHHKHH